MIWNRITLIAPALLLAIPTVALAQDETTGAATRVFDHFLVRGGAITWFILVPLSVATVALTIQYCVLIRRATFVPRDTYDRLAHQLTQQRFTQAIQEAGEDPSVLGNVVHSGLLEARNGYPAMERAVEESLESWSARSMRRIEYLNVIGNISPMVGLFGTVYGMISLFASIKEAGGMPEPSRVADDISIALVTTFWGLLVAIPALSIFALFRNRIDVLTAECAIAADRLLTPFKPGSRPAASLTNRSSVPSSPASPPRPAATPTAPPEPPTGSQPAPSPVPPRATQAPGTA